MLIMSGLPQFTIQVITRLVLYSATVELKLLLSEQYTCVLYVYSKFKCSVGESKMPFTMCCSTDPFNFGKYGVCGTHPPPPNTSCTMIITIYYYVVMFVSIVAYHEEH